MDPEAKKRREQFSRRLLVENNPSTASDGQLDVCNMETRHACGGLDSSEAESDGKFRQLQEVFARKTEQRKKGKTTQDRPSKKQEELGPSGEPYTALELQVNQLLIGQHQKVHCVQVLRLKAKHEGVLLMIEVGYKYRFFGDDAKVRWTHLFLLLLIQTNLCEDRCQGTWNRCIPGP